MLESQFREGMVLYLMRETPSGNAMSKPTPIMFTLATETRRCMNTPQSGQSPRRFPEMSLIGR
jgi:hypothetical protein